MEEDISIQSLNSSINISAEIQNYFNQTSGNMWTENETNSQFQNGTYEIIEPYVADPEVQEILEMSETISKKIMPVVLTLIIIFGVIGNLLVICVILRDKYMRNGSYLMFLNLAMADMLYLAICLPATISENLLGRWTLGEAMCKIVYFTVDVSVYVSIYTLVLICLARFLAVAFPVQFSSSQTLSCSITACTLIWIIMLVSNIQVLIRTKLQPIRDQLSGEIIMNCMKADFHETKKVVLYFFIFAYALPLVIITVLNGIIVLQLQSAATSDYLSLATRRRRKRFRQLVILVIIGFAICWGPINVFGMIQTHSLAPILLSPVWTILNTVSNCMAYANSMMNPILYNIGSSDFRRAFKESMRSCRTCVCVRSSERNIPDVVANVNKDKTRSSSDNPSDLGMATCSMPSRLSMPTVSSTSV